MTPARLFRNFSGVLATLAIVLLFAGAAQAQSSGPGNGAGAGAGGPGASGSDGGHRHGGDDPPLILDGGTPNQSCGGAPILPDPSAYADAGDGVKAVSRATRAYIEGCHCDTQACIADALDAYAAALAVVAPRLPPQLRNLPSIVSTAARRVRVARSKGEAVRILQNAVATVHKEIELMRADNPDALQRATRGGGFVAGTLQIAALKLQKADEL